MIGWNFHCYLRDFDLFNFIFITNMEIFWSSSGAFGVHGNIGVNSRSVKCL